MADPLYLRILAGFAILLIGFGVGILVRKIAQKILHNLKVNKALLNLGLPWNLENGVSALLSFLTYILTIFFFLNQLKITSFVIYLATISIIILVSLSLFVAIKDTIPNFLAWVLLRRQKNLGQKVAWNEIRGIIIHQGYLETRLRTPQGDILHVPNSLLLKFVRQ